MSPREVRRSVDWSVSGYGLYERLFDVRKTGQAARVDICEHGQGERVYPLQEQPTLRRSVGFASGPFGVSHMLEQALVRLDQAAQHLTVDADVLEKLKFPRETIQVRLMIRMDDGSRKSFMAWRCRYDDTRGPTKGGNPVSSGSYSGRGGDSCLLDDHEVRSDESALRWWQGRNPGRSSHAV